MRICGITLHEPWATLLMIPHAQGGKGNETRNWATDYRGPLIIHAGKTLDADVCREEPFVTVLKAHFGRWDFLDRFRLGHIIGATEMLDCLKTEVVRPTLTGNEEAFGNYGPNRYAWITDYPTPLPNPIPFRGMQKLWYVPENVLGQIVAQVPQCGIVWP